MQYFPKVKAVLVLFVLSLILFVFMLLVTPNTITNVSAVEANGVGVYWDSNCTERVFSIDWGTLTPGSLKSIPVYIRNEVEEPVYLRMATMDWSPSKASDYITVRWNYSGQRINPGESRQITLTLSVSRNIEEVSSFSFGILITGSDRLLGDLDGDGRITSLDLAKFGAAYGSTPGQPNWNPEADFDSSGAVGSTDYCLLVANYGKSFQEEKP